MPKRVIYKSWLLGIFLLLQFTSKLLAQSLTTGNEKIDAVFGNAQKMMQLLENKNDDKSALQDLLLFNKVPNIYPGRLDDYYLLAQKIVELREIVRKKIRALQSRPDARPKDPFETTDQYKQRLSFLETQVLQEYKNDVSPIESEIKTLTSRFYTAINPSAIRFPLDVSMYDADRSIWKVRVLCRDIESVITLNINPANAKALWENRSLITITDITDIFGELQYAEIAIPDLNWKIFLQYVTSNNISSEDQVFTKVEVEAQFPGGDAAWNRFVQREVEKRIDDLTDDGRSGTCEVQFIVDKEGNVSAVEALTMKGTTLAEVAVNAIQKGPKWVPATQNGRQVRAWRRQKLTFRLPDE